MDDIARSNSLPDLAARIRAEHQAVGEALTHALAAGQLLIEAKGRVPYGDWLPWLEQNCELKERTAQAYMRIARELAKLEPAKAQRVADLSVRDAVKELAKGTRAAKLSPQGLDQALEAAGAAAGNLTLDDAYQQARRAEKAEFEQQPEVTLRQAQGARTSLILKTHRGEEVPYPQPKGKATFNETNDQVSWAKWTWNPVTGCLHDCAYCYSREMAETRESYRAAYPVGFTPLFHHERLDAPANTRPPPEGTPIDSPDRRVFVTSMGDLFGKWVPSEWIEQVLASARRNPQWDYLFLTKFPRRYVDLDFPATAWVGTSVDEQKRVRLAEDAFRRIKNVRVKWLSLEPLLAPLEFSDLSMFDWIVIGSQSATRQPNGKGGFVTVPEFAPPFEWVARLTAQAREAGCRVYQKPNLIGEPSPQRAGMQLIQEAPFLGDAPRRSK